MSELELFIEICIAISTILLSFIVSFLFINQKRHFTYLKEKQDIHSQFRQELLQSQLEIQEQTFKTISQELHDNIGQVLTLAKLNLNTLDINVKDKAIDKIDDAKSLISKAIQDIRDLSKTMNTDTIATVGLCNAIQMELNMLEKTGTIKTGFQAIGDSTQINPQVELILFRIVQEAFHNIINTQRLPI